MELTPSSPEVDSNQKKAGDQPRGQNNFSRDFCAQQRQIIDCNTNDVCCKDQDSRAQIESIKFSEKLPQPNDFSFPIGLSEKYLQQIKPPPPRPPHVIQESYDNGKPLADTEKKKQPDMQELEIDPLAVDAVHKTASEPIQDNTDPNMLLKEASITPCCKHQPSISLGNDQPSSNIFWGTNDNSSRTVNGNFGVPPPPAPPPTSSFTRRSTTTSRGSFEARFVEPAPSVISRLGGAILGSAASAASVAAAAVGAAAGGATEVARYATGTLLSSSSSPSTISRTVSTKVFAPPPPPSTLAGNLGARRYRTTTIIKDGILDKWTNYLGAWRARYFVVEPGILKYANAPGQPIKETFPLVLCSTRLCPGDGLRLEVEHPHGVLYLRLPSPEEKKSWIDALLCARNSFQQQQHQQQTMKTRRLGIDHPPPPPPPPPFSSSTILHPPIPTIGAEAHDLIPRFPKTGEEGIDQHALEEATEMSGSDDEKSPMVTLMENCAACRQSLQTASNDLGKIQAHMLRLAGHVKDAQFRDDFKNLTLRLVEVIEYFQVATSRHLLTAETLAADEQQQRRALQRYLRVLARRNYRMRMKLQAVQRLLLQGSPNIMTNSKNQDALREETKLINIQSVNEEDANQQRSNLFDTVPSSNENLHDSLRQSKLATLLLEGLSDDESPSSSASVDEERAYTVLDDNDDDFGEFYDAEEGIVDVLHRNLTKENSLSYTADEKGIIRRTELPKPRTDFKVSLWSILKDCVGKDLSRISIPVYFNEPTSFLQRLAEDFQYAALLKESAKLPNSIDRLLYVTVFSMSPYASTVGRTYKPFNPLLGETFELSHRGFRFLAEQVGHHPPVTAYYADSEEFQAWGHLIVNTRFTGKSVEVSLPGNINVVLYPNNTTDSSSEPDHFTYQRAKAIINNVIFGKLSLEMFGHVLITNHTTGDFAYVEYLRQGWWSRELHVVRGLVFDKEGYPHYRLGGWWSREIWVEEIDPEDAECFKQPPADSIGPRIDSPTLPFPPLSPPESGIFQGAVTYGDPVGPLKYYARDPLEIQVKWDELRSSPGSRRIIWRSEPRPPNSARFYEFGQMTMELNDLSSDYNVALGASISPTDSRYRPDQRLLESGQTEFANMEKNRLEEKQRAYARARGGTEIDYQPRWFYRGIDPATNHSAWLFTGEYWHAKQHNLFTNCRSIF